MINSGKFELIKSYTEKELEKEWFDYSGQRVIEYQYMDAQGLDIERCDIERVLKGMGYTYSHYYAFGYELGINIIHRKYVPIKERRITNHEEATDEGIARACQLIINKMVKDGLNDFDDFDVDITNICNLKELVVASGMFDRSVRLTGRKGSLYELLHDVDLEDY